METRKQDEAPQAPNPDYQRPQTPTGTIVVETRKQDEAPQAPNPDHQRPLTDRLEEIVETWANSHYELVTLAAEFADSPEWILTGSPTAAHWLAIVADVEPCTTREWPCSFRA